ncbi:hypothetical protein AAGF08_00990 [Algoriphagus sp. SE2]|uniref:glycosyl-4,4'-diaponeurosporenoate acyltransferase CrtO family protein n=1 Tax=Algoriphagus sp. SE2 TaxID=3141536 RepID=UPI0031CD8A28
MKTKTILKKVFLSLGSIFLFYRSYELIINWEKLQSSNNTEAVLFSILANLFILGSFALAGFAWPTYSLLPSKYYEIRFPKQILKFGKLIGVPIFQKFLLMTFWSNKDQQKRYFNGTKTGIFNWVKESKMSEFGHLIPFFILVFLSIWSLGLGFWKMSLINLILNILANLYPVLLQRTHRARLSPILKRLKDSTNNSA